MPKSPVVARKRVKRLLTFDFSSSSKMAFLGLGGGRLGSLSGGSSGSCLIIPADKEKTNKEDSVIYLAALIMGLMIFFLVCIQLREAAVEKLFLRVVVPD